MLSSCAPTKGSHRFSMSLGNSAPVATRSLREQAALEKLTSEVGSEALAACPPLLLHMLASWDFLPLLESKRRARHQADWRRLLEMLSCTSPPTKAVQDRFHTQWHVCHHFIRELVDDDRLMLAAARGWLPPYDGPGLTLFRGENIGRFQTGRVGYGWTDDVSVAEMFARGLNGNEAGGVVLTAEAPPSAIVAGPGWHSSDWLHENEFTVDVQRLEGMGVVSWHRR